MTLKIKQTSNPELAKRVDEAGNNDGRVSAAEIVEVLAEASKAKSSWADDRPALADLGAELGMSRTTSAQVFPLTSLYDAVDLSRVEPTQIEVLRESEIRAAANSKAAHPKLIERAKSLGYTEAQLKKALKYVRDKAPVTVNFMPDKQTGSGEPMVASLLKEPTYKNQFETKISGGTLAPHVGGDRDNWEKKLFVEGYHQHNLIPDERPKYGALNAHAAAAGGAKWYGSSYFTLNSEARQRATFTPSDSSQSEAYQVGTLNHLEHVLLATDENLFVAIMAEVTGEDSTGWSSGYSYIEAQIHGPLDLMKDVSEVTISTDYRGTDVEKQLRKLAKKNHMTISWTDGVSTTPDDAM